MPCHKLMGKTKAAASPEHDRHLRDAGHVKAIDYLEARKMWVKVSLVGERTVVSLTKSRLLPQTEGGWEGVKLRVSI